MTTASDLVHQTQKLKIKANFRGVMMKDELRRLRPECDECGIINLSSSAVTQEENKEARHWIFYYGFD